jgi:WG containing repeat
MRLYIFTIIILFTHLSFSNDKSTSLTDESQQALKQSHQWPVCLNLFGQICGVYDSHKKKWIIPFQYQQVVKLDKIWGAKIISKNGADGLWEIHNTDGKLISKNQFKSFSEASENLIPAQSSENLLWGYINFNGDWKIEPKYANAKSFSNHRAWVTDSIDQKKNYLINEEGVSLLTISGENSLPLCQSKNCIVRQYLQDQNQTAVFDHNGQKISQLSEELTDTGFDSYFASKPGQGFIKLYDQKLKKIFSIQSQSGLISIDSSAPETLWAAANNKENKNFLVNVKTGNIHPEFQKSDVLYSVIHQNCWPVQQKNNNFICFDPLHNKYLSKKFTNMSPFSKKWVIGLNQSQKYVFYNPESDKTHDFIFESQSFNNTHDLWQSIYNNFHADHFVWLEKNSVSYLFDFTTDEPEFNLTKKKSKFCDIEVLRDKNNLLIWPTTEQYACKVLDYYKNFINSDSSVFPTPVTESEKKFKDWFDDVQLKQNTNCDLDRMVNLPQDYLNSNWNHIQFKTPEELNIDNLEAAHSSAQSKSKCLNFNMQILKSSKFQARLLNTPDELLQAMSANKYDLAQTENPDLVFNNWLITPQIEKQNMLWAYSESINMNRQNYIHFAQWSNNLIFVVSFNIDSQNQKHISRMANIVKNMFAKINLNSAGIQSTENESIHSLDNIIIGPPSKTSMDIQNALARQDPTSSGGAFMAFMRAFIKIAPFIGIALLGYFRSRRK